jgi:hypothetical protein
VDACGIMAGGLSHVRLSPVERIPAPDMPVFADAAQSIVAAGVRKKIYCKAGAYQ